MARAGGARLSAEPRFVRWAVAEGISMLGTAVSTVALPLVVYDATGSAAQTGGLFAIRVVPYLIFGFVAGPVADRGNRRLLIIGGNLVEGALVATVPLAHVLGVLTVGQVYLVALLSATAFVFSDAAVFGAVPALVGAERLAAANGLLSGLAAGADIVGPVIAGVAIASLGATATIWLDAVSFLVAAAVQLTIRSSFREGAARVTTPVREHMRVAIRFVRDDRVLSTLLVSGFGNSFGFGIVIGLLVPYAVEQLGVQPDDAAVGLLYGALGVGALLASAAFSRVFRPTRVPLITPLSLFVAGTTVVVLITLDEVGPAVAALVLFSTCITMTITTGITYRQLAAPDELRSSVNVLGRMVAWGGQPFGAAVGALVSAALDVPAAYGVAATVMFGSGVGAATALHGSHPLVASPHT